jgi:hypothetical protein
MSGCRDLKERKACRKSKDVCSWCVAKYGGMTSCMDEVRGRGARWGLWGLGGLGVWGLSWDGLRGGKVGQEGDKRLL